MVARNWQELFNFYNFQILSNVSGANNFRLERVTSRRWWKQFGMFNLREEEGCTWAWRNVYVPNIQPRGERRMIFFGFIYSGNLTGRTSGGGRMMMMTDLCWGFLMSLMPRGKFTSDAWFLGGLARIRGKSGNAWGLSGQIFGKCLRWMCYGQKSLKSRCLIPFWTKIGPKCFEIYLFSRVLIFLTTSADLRSTI